jgi:hypothetical protein
MRMGAEASSIGTHPGVSRGMVTKEVAMDNEGSGGAGTSRPASILMESGSKADLPPALRLQILTTEHWNLLSTRAMSWNEAFSRATMFLSVLSGAVVALALVAQVTAFGEAFLTFALLILPVVLFIGVATFVRLVQINHEDVRWVIGMNLLRHAYLDAAPELRPYFVTGWHDDEAGIMTTFAAKPGPGGFAHQFVTTPGILAVVNGMVAGTLAGVIAPRTGLGSPAGIGLAIAISLVTVGLQALHQYRGVVAPRGRYQARFPEASPRVG